MSFCCSKNLILCIFSFLINYESFEICYWLFQFMVQKKKRFEKKSDEATEIKPFVIVFATAKECKVITCMSLSRQSNLHRIVVVMSRSTHGESNSQILPVTILSILLSGSTMRCKSLLYRLIGAKSFRWTTCIWGSEIN